MKKLTFGLILLTMIVSIGLSSCSKSEIEGKWEMKEKTEEFSWEMEFEFKSNGKFIQTMEMESPAPKMKFKMKVKGEYTYENHVLTFKANSSDAEVEECKIEGMPENMVNAFIEQQKENLSRYTNVVNNVEVNGNTLTGVVEGGVPITLTKD